MDKRNNIVDARWGQNMPRFEEVRLQSFIYEVVGQQKKIKIQNQ